MRRLLTHLSQGLFILVIGAAAIGFVLSLLVWLGWNVVGPGTWNIVDILFTCCAFGATVIIAYLTYEGVKALIVARRKKISFYEAYEGMTEYSLDKRRGFKNWDAARFRSELRLARNKSRAANAILRS